MRLRPSWHQQMAATRFLTAPATDGVIDVNMHDARTPAYVSGKNTHAPAAKINKKNRSDITPDPGGHRPQRPCAQGRTYAKQDQPQASAPGQNRTQCGGGATTHGLRTRQAGKSCIHTALRRWCSVPTKGQNSQGCAQLDMFSAEHCHAFQQTGLGPS